MRISYKGKNYNVSEHLKKIADKKLTRLDKYFQNDVDTRVLFTEEGTFQKVEVTIFLTGNVVLRSEKTSDEMYNAIDQAVDSLESQIRKHKTKLQKRFNSKNTIRFENIENIPEEPENKKKIARVKEFGLKPMDAEEAILQMELVGHNFFVFLDGDSNTVQVVYRRKDGNYGLLIPGF